MHASLTSSPRVLRRCASRNRCAVSLRTVLLRSSTRPRHDAGRGRRSHQNPPCLQVCCLYPPPPGLQAKYYYSQDGVKWSDLQPVDEATAARCAKIKVRCAPHAWHANAKPASQLVPSHRLSKAALAHASSCQSHEHASGGGGAARAAAIAPRASSSACARTATSMCACKATAHAANRGRAWWSLKEGTTLALTRPTLSVGCRLP